MQRILNFRLHFEGSVPDSTEKDNRLLQWVLVEAQEPQIDSSVHDNVFPAYGGTDTTCE